MPLPRQHRRPTPGTIDLDQTAATLIIPTCFVMPRQVGTAGFLRCYYRNIADAHQRRHDRRRCRRVSRCWFLHCARGSAGRITADPPSRFQILSRRRQPIGKACCRHGRHSAKCHRPRKYVSGKAVEDNPVDGTITQGRDGERQFHSPQMGYQSF